MMIKLLVLTMVLGLLVSGCAVSQLMVNPQTGRSQRCAYSGGVIPVLVAQDQCIQAAKQLGYIEIEKAATTGMGVHNRDPLSEVIVTQIVPNSPAYKIGIKVKDKIIEKNGQPIQCIGDINSMPRLQIGERVTYKMDRNGEILIFELVAVPFTSLHSPESR